MTYPAGREVETFDWVFKLFHTLWHSGISATTRELSEANLNDFVDADSEGSGESAQLRRLIRALNAR